MAHIVFNVFPAVSHYNSTFDVALLLKNHGHQISYISHTDEYSEHVRAKGFSFSKYSFANEVYRHPFTSAIEFLLMLINQQAASYIADLYNMKSFEKAALEETLFDTIVSELKPNLVLFDGALSLNALVFKKYGIPCAIFQPYFRLDKERYFPSLTSGLKPVHTFWGGVRAELSWQRYFLSQAARRWITRALFFGAEPRTMAAKIAEKRSRQKEIEVNKNFYFGIKDVPEIYFCAEELDFPRVKARDVLCINPIVSRQRADTGYDYSYATRIKEIRIRSKENSSPIVYCSLGSRNVIQFKGCRSFLQKIIYAFSNLNYELIIATGENIEPHVFRSVGKNIHVFQTVPQYDLLQISDLMITHGGMISILECINHEVPMIVYPLTKNWDQHGNAARTVHHGLGLRGNIKNEKIRQIRKKVEQILTNHDYKRRVQSMKRKIEENFDSCRIINALESLM